MPSQCDRLEAALRSGRKLTQRAIFDELLIGNHTGRISELRPKFRAEGIEIKCELIKTNQGETGLYYLVDPNRPENVPGKGDAYEE